jgi:hypothetical protein
VRCLWASPTLASRTGIVENSGFRFNPEHWFGPNTGSGGTGKLGHFYTTYVMSDLLFHAIRGNSNLQEVAELTAATLALGLMFYVKIFDGYSGDHGFSREDMTMDLLGAGFSVLRNTVPGLKEVLDFRLKYLPSGYKGFDPLADYAGQKYLFALKLAGFEVVRESPLRFLELHAGYDTRGFTKEERALGLEKERNLYFGIGLNLQEAFVWCASDQIPLGRTGWAVGPRVCAGTLYVNRRKTWARVEVARVRVTPPLARMARDCSQQVQCASFRRSSGISTGARSSVETSGVLALDWHGQGMLRSASALDSQN